MATRGAVVAIACGDPGEEYYLMQVTGDGPETLQLSTTDDWGMTYPAGAEIIRGLFNERTNEFQCYRKNIHKINTFWCMLTQYIRYICPQLPNLSRTRANCVFKISEELHLNILESLEGF